MSRAGHKPIPGQSQPLAEFLKKALPEREISLRTAAKHIGIDCAFLSRIMNDKKTPNAHVCNLIADYFEIPRVQVYAMAGWLDLDDVTDLKAVQALKTLFPEPNDQADIEWVYSNIGDRNARTLYIQLLQKLRGGKSNGDSDSYDSPA